MSEIELIERLRRATEEAARSFQEESGLVTCEESRRSPPRPHYCCDVWRGHQCRYSDQPNADGVRHPRAPHACRCGIEWGHR